MNPTAAACPHCGYDFPSTEIGSKSQRDGFAYSALADVALIISSAAAALGALGALYITFVTLWLGDIFTGLVQGPIAFFLLLGMLVVFLRVQNPQ